MKPIRLVLAFLTCSYIASVIFINVAQTNPSVLIEFLYYDKLCPYCPGMEKYYAAYVHNSRVVLNVERYYGDNVCVKRIYWNSEEGLAKRNAYNLSLSDWNTIIVNEEVILKGGDQLVDETQLRQIIDYFLTLEHDIAINDVTINSRSIMKGDSLNINITVSNKGEKTESFNITVSFNSTVVEELRIELLEPKVNRTVSIHINTTEIDVGCYILTVCVVPVENEVNTNNNLYNAGMVEIRIQDIGPKHIHDIAVLEVIPSKWLANVEEQINVTVLVKNLGTIAENFTLKLSLNESLITESDVQLDLNSNCSIVFTVKLANLTPGNYVVKAVVELKDDLNPENNECSSIINVSMLNGINKISFLGHIFLAFIFGFFETFSPCLLVLLSFLVSYTAGETTSFKEGFTRILTFGVGFLSAALLISTFAFFLFSITPFQKITTMIVCIFAILFGLNVMGINIKRSPKKQQNSVTKTIVQKLARKYANTFLGMIMLGFLFYFLDPCIAPFFFAIIPLMLNINSTLIILAFCLGVFLPFVLVGVVTGSLSRLVRISYKHKSKLRLMSGLILICYAAYIIFIYVL